MCVLSIKVSIRKKSGNLFNDPYIYIYIYIIYLLVHYPFFFIKYDFTVTFYLFISIALSSYYYNKLQLLIHKKKLGLWGQAVVKGKLCYRFFIWLHSEGILFYPTLSSGCNSLNKKAPKELYERRQQRFFYIFPLFPGFNNHSMDEGIFPEYNWNGWISQSRCLKIC